MDETASWEGGSDGEVSTWDFLNWALKSEGVPVMRIVFM